MGSASNAIRPETAHQISGEIASLELDDSIRAIILGHAGKHFVGGADFTFLESLKTASDNTIREEIYGSFQGLTRRLYRCRKPTVAAIAGAAVTIGCEAAIACDFRIVTKDARFQESWIRLGLMPPLGGLKTLPALVGYGLASDMVLRGRAVGGEEAVQCGLAHMLVSPEELDNAAITLATELAQAAPLAYAAAKENLRRGLDRDLDDVLRIGIDVQTTLIKSDDFAEGVDAAVAKRAARFSGH